MYYITDCHVLTAKPVSINNTLFLVLYVSFCKCTQMQTCTTNTCDAWRRTVKLTVSKGEQSEINKHWCIVAFIKL